MTNRRKALKDRRSKKELSKSPSILKEKLFEALLQILVGVIIEIIIRLLL